MIVRSRAPTLHARVAMLRSGRPIRRASSLIYSLLNKHWTVKCTSVEGMGKDGVDANNGREQPVLAQAR